MNTARNLSAVLFSLALTGVLSAATYNASVHAEGRHSDSTLSRLFHRAFHATVIVDGQSRVLSSDASDVSALLSHVGLSVGPGDELRPPASCGTFDGMTVVLNTRRTRRGLVRSEIPYKTIYKKTIRLMPGRKSEVQPGRTGLREEQVEVTSVGVRDVERRVLSAVVARAPVNQVVMLGTNPLLASRGMEGAGRMLSMSATMYDVYLGGSGSGYTCTGMHARRGIAAVDPRVIPLGSRLYVEGYGYCVAADTGGAIKGHRIDLCVESPREADAYGRHRVRVVVLN